MLIDHVGILFFPDEPLLRVIGRVSFPLFAFLIAEGERKTSDSSRYLARLTAFAIISQLPYELFIRAAGVASVPINIFATLSFGLLARLLLKRFSLRYSLPAVAVILFLSEYLSFDGGAYGILTILGSALFLSVRGWGTAYLLSLPVIDAVIRFLYGTITIQFFAFCSVPVVMLYNGEKGRPLPRWFFYSFYPVHLLLLWLIWYALIRTHA